jgi:hypothetical protein
MRNKDGSTFRVAWRKANPGAKDFPYITCFGTSHFDPEQNKYNYAIPFVDAGGIGEIPERSPKYPAGTYPPWPVGDHVCGTPQQWAEGFDVPFSSTPFGPDRIPLCCLTGAEFNNDYGPDYWI